jgi:phage shock protein C
MLMNRRLTRSRRDRVLGGVAAGLAEYLNTDPALVRIAWAILVPLTGGAAFLAYIVGWIVIPEAPLATDANEAHLVGSEPGSEPTSAPASERSSGVDSGRAGIIVGIGLVLLGAWFLVREYLDIDWSLIWPLALVAIGGLILVTSARRREP